MNNSTPEKEQKEHKIAHLKKISKHASDDTLFFIRMFARACQPLVVNLENTTVSVR